MSQSLLIVAHTIDRECTNCLKKLFFWKIASKSFPFTEARQGLQLFEKKNIDNNAVTCSCLERKEGEKQTIYCLKAPKITPGQNGYSSISFCLIHSTINISGYMRIKMQMTSYHKITHKLLFNWRDDTCKEDHKPLKISLKSKKEKRSKQIWLQVRNWSIWIFNSSSQLESALLSMKIRYYILRYVRVRDKSPSFDEIYWQYGSETTKNGAQQVTLNPFSWMA